MIRRQRAASIQGYDYCRRSWVASPLRESARGLIKGFVAEADVTESASLFLVAPR